MIARSEHGSFSLVGILSLATVVAVGTLVGQASVQVEDADCFSGNCGGSKGIPECPTGDGEVGLVLYANSKVDQLSFKQAAFSWLETLIARRSRERAWSASREARPLTWCVTRTSSAATARP